MRAGAACLAAMLAASIARADGSIAGRVVLAGAPAALAPLAVTKDQAACGTRVPDESLRVGADGTLADAVVFLDPAPPAAGGAAAGAARGGEVVLDQIGCRFVPHVMAARVGARLVALNSDPILHNVHGRTDGARTAFNVALPIRGLRTPVTLRAPGIIRAQCDAGHTWMSAFIHVFEHPFHAVTGADGSFAIRGVPAGRHTLAAWHERLGRRTATVEVSDGGTAEARIAFEPPPK